MRNDIFVDFQSNRRTWVEEAKEERKMDEFRKIIATLFS